MYVPVAVISLVLFASSGFTQTLKANESVSGVNQTTQVHPAVHPTVHPAVNPAVQPAVQPTVHPKIPSLNKTLQIDVDHSVVMSNKSTNVQVSLKPPIKRPSNACTQTNGVRSTCIQAGKRINGDQKNKFTADAVICLIEDVVESLERLGVKKILKKPGKANTEQLEAFSYMVKPGLVNKGFVISHIMVTNKMKLGVEGLVSVVRGGTLETEVVLLLESQTGRRMDFQIEIFVAPVARAYKGQLGSLISNLKSL